MRLRRVLAVVGVLAAATASHAYANEEIVITFDDAEVGKPIPTWTAQGVVFEPAGKLKRSKAVPRVMFFPHLMTDKKGILSAMAAEAAFFQVRECHSLAEGIEAAGRDRFDVVVLATDLPDAWPSDIFPRFVEKAPDSPILLIVEDCTAMLKNAERRPFCVVERARADPTTMRRLVISAGILMRTVGALPQS